MGGVRLYAALALAALVGGCGGSGVSSDEFSTFTQIYGSSDTINPLLGPKVEWQIESIVAKAPPHAVEHRLIARVYSNDLASKGPLDKVRFRFAADDTAAPLKVASIANESCGFGNAGCFKHETIAVQLADAMLRERALSGYRVKIWPAEGEERILTLSPAMIRRQLVQVDDLVQGEAPKTALNGPRLGIGGIAATATPYDAEPRGVIVLETANQSPAAAGGIQPGDVLLAIDAQPVRVTGDIARIVAGLASGRAVTLQLKRGGMPYTTTVQL
ncbi:MAG TPA: PDZ domain-containing protein [Stellaceae bacterium]|nr:PDZ domain-containing protein [Stellaceae bacterium]